MSGQEKPMIDRRAMIGALGAVAMADRAGAAATTALPFANGARPLAAYPGKRPLIRLTERPPQLETPFGVFGEGLITPNDAFFVRYHLADLPLDLDPAAWRLAVDGLVERPLSLSLAQLRRDFAPVSLVAVNQCSGNSRGFVSPRVAGGQLGNGAMGNAKWTGVPLRAVLDRAGVKAGAVQATFDGLDRPIAEGTPDFVKALALDHARDGEVMLAWAMNDRPLPFLNGAPLRLVVPGWFGTYWVKHLSRIAVIDKGYDGYWMKSAYRVPHNDCQCVPPGTRPAATRPISRLAVRSFVTSHGDGAAVAAGRPVTVSGIAFDGGSGIARVTVSADGGRTWRAAALGPEASRYAFRGWRTTLTLPPGAHRLLVRATSRAGEDQPPAARWNPSGYLRNAVEAITVRAA